MEAFSQIFPFEFIFYLILVFKHTNFLFGHFYRNAFLILTPNYQTCWLASKLFMNVRFRFLFLILCWEISAWMTLGKTPKKKLNKKCDQRVISFQLTCKLLCIFPFICLIWLRGLHWRREIAVIIRVICFKRWSFRILRWDKILPKNTMKIGFKCISHIQNDTIYNDTMVFSTLDFR